MTYAQALEALFQRRRFGIRPGLDGICALLGALGEPQRELQAIHIAGTNGKGSTAAFCESMLRLWKVVLPVGRKAFAKNALRLLF